MHIEGDSAYSVHRGGAATVYNRNFLQFRC